MRKIIKNIIKLISPKYEKYLGIIILNRLKNFFSKSSIENKYLFILSPPYCGSTLLNEIISTSPNVSVNNPYWTREGQTLPTVKNIMFKKSERWNKAVDFDWLDIKKEWRKYWDISKPILLEKSPPNILRAQSINHTFKNAYFIIFYRNPYAHCESLMSRNKMGTESAAKFAIDCLERQKENMDLGLRYISVSYEKLTSDPKQFKREVLKFLPEIDKMDFSMKFHAHNFKNKAMQIENLNDEKIRRLDQNQIARINEVFEQNLELLDFFQYSLITRTHNKKHNT